MFIEILKHTPTWVFFLFFILLVLGYFQSKPRTVAKGKIFILPCTMIALSFYGVISAFDLEPTGILSWFIGVAAAIWLGLKLSNPKSVIYFEQERAFSMPGSWLPLILMMAIFFTKYAVGVVLARQLPIAVELEFIAIISLLYGCFSGLFFSRLLVIRQSINQGM